MTGGSGERSLRLLDRVMAISALATLATLVFRYGLGFGAEHDRWIALADAAFVLLFAGAQAAKLTVVPDPAVYLRAHRLDFALLFVLVVQLVAYGGLRSTGEFLWLERHGAPSPLWPILVASVQVYMVAIVALRSTEVTRLPELERYRCCDYAIAEAFDSLHMWEQAARYEAKWNQGMAKGIRSDGKKRWKRMRYQALSVLDQYNAGGTEI